MSPWKLTSLLLIVHQSVEAQIAPPPRSTYEFGPYLLDVGEYRLLHNGREIKLRPKVMDFLVVLLKHPKQLLTKEELLQEVWPNVEVEEGNLPICVKELR